MSKTNFNKKPNRWDYYERRADHRYNLDNYNLQGDVLNFGIADINYKSPQPILDAIKDRAEKGTYSYSYTSDTTLFAIEDWYNRFHGISIDRKWIKIVHGTVNAMHQVVQCFTKENDYVLIQTPIYKPFSEAIINNKRKIADNKLIEDENTYKIDFDDFEKQIIEKQIKLFMLCSPHNPGSVVWDKDTIDKIVQICAKHDVMIFSDEVHSDMTFKKFTSLADYNYENNIVANSPNKIFNLGGLKASYLIIKNNKVRQKIDAQYTKNYNTSLNVFMNDAFQKAYLDKECELWLDELREYIYENYVYLKVALDKLNWNVFKLESTYLVWVKLPFDSSILVKYLKKNNIIICDYTDFYGANNHFIRINIATTRSDIEQLLNVFRNFVHLQKRRDNK